MNSAPVSSQHSQTKKPSPVSEDLHQSLPVLDEESVPQTHGNLPQAGNYAKQSAPMSSAYNRFAPPPPRRHRPAPPPRHEHSKDSIQQQKQNLRRQHQPNTATVHNSIEDLAASFFSSGELNRPRKNATTNPGPPQSHQQPMHGGDSDVRTERLKPPAPPPKRTHLTRNDLDIAAAQLINMQSQKSGQSNSEVGAGEAPLPFNSQQHIGVQHVDNMPYTDYDSGSCGLYSGSCDNFGRPHGQGVILYDNNACIKVGARNRDLFLMIPSKCTLYHFRIRERGPTGYSWGERCLFPGFNNIPPSPGASLPPPWTSGVSKKEAQELGALRWAAGPCERLTWSKIESN